MKKIKVDSTVGMHRLIDFLKTGKSDSDLLFFFTKENKIYKNGSNLQILKNIAEENGKTLVFEVENPTHRDYIDAINQETLSYTNDFFDLEEDDNLFRKVKNNISNLFAGIKNSKDDNIEKPILKNKKKNLKILKIIIITLLSIGVVSGGIVLGYINIPSATVKLTLDTKGFVSLLNVKANPNLTEIDLKNGAIPVLEIAVEEADTLSIPTTGEKEIGDKATGKVTIYNKTSKDRTIDKGTKIKLISKNKDSLLFFTTEEIKVSAKEEVSAADPLEPPTVTYGKRNVEIEASLYGEDYNLGKDQTFEVDEYDTDEIVAGNEKKIFGGNSEIVHVVKQKDIDDVTKLLEKSLVDKVTNLLKQKIVDGQTLNEPSIITKIVQKKFNNELDAQVENLSLVLTMEATGLAYKTEDLDKVVSELAKKSIPEKFDWNGDSTEYEVAVVKDDTEENSGLNLQIKLTTHITPKINKAKIADDLSGMTVVDAEKYLEELANIKKYSIDFKNMPAFFVRLPLKPINIKVELLND